MESIAVCFLHAYVSSVHEIRTRQIIQEVFPAALVSLSAEVAPEFREYFRASTTVINAAIRPVVGRYLHSIEARLRQQELQAELLVMQSSGGVFSFAAAGEKPVFIKNQFSSCPKIFGHGEKPVFIKNGNQFSSCPKIFGHGEETVFIKHQFSPCPFHQKPVFAMAENFRA